MSMEFTPEQIGDKLAQTILAIEQDEMDLRKAESIFNGFGKIMKQQTNELAYREHIQKGGAQIPSLQRKGTYGK
jgi:hypothetical protein